MEVDFEHRTPSGDDEQDRHGRPAGRRPLDRVGRRRPGAGSRAACCSGCPGSNGEILWNDRTGRPLRVLHARCADRADRRTIPHPVYAREPRRPVRPRARLPPCNDCGRATATPGCATRAGANKRPAPRATGGTTSNPAGRSRPYRLRRSRPATHAARRQVGQHWFNHLLFNPRRLAAGVPPPLANGRARGASTPECVPSISRQEPPNPRPFGLYLAFHLAQPWGTSSLGPAGRRGTATTCSRTRTADRGGGVVGDGIMTENGHCSYLPGGKWILNDTYPDRAAKAKRVLVPGGQPGERSAGEFLKPRRCTRGNGGATPIPARAPTAAVSSSTRPTTATADRCT